MAVKAKNSGVKKSRRLKVYSKGFARETNTPMNNNYVFFPNIILAGKWLQQHGFFCGQSVEVLCEEGRLVITRVKG